MEKELKRNSYWIVSFHYLSLPSGPFPSLSSSNGEGEVGDKKREGSERKGCERDKGFYLLGNMPVK